MITLGYVSLNTKLASSSKTFRLSSYTNEKMLAYTRDNLKALLQILEWNKVHGILLFRITSGLVPFGSARINNGSWKVVLKEEFEKIGDFVKRNNMRVSMHPGQYTVLNSPNHTFYENSLLDLEYHNSILDLMALPKSHKIILHGGGIYGDKKAATKLLIQRVNNLSTNVRERLVLENDDRCFNARDILNICYQIDLPGVFDYFHDQVLPSIDLDSRDIIIEYGKTWPKNEIQKIHYSEQDPGKIKGSHSESINPDKFMILYDKIKDLDLDIMLEVKDKEQSVLKLKRILNI